jgi:DNA-binding transcriptional regulator YiaG
MESKPANPPDWDSETVKALRNHMGLSQQDMAQELGTRQQTISEWERGVYRPRGAPRTLRRIISERGGFRYSTNPSTGPSPS